jgi:hypothetical protein
MESPICQKYSIDIFEPLGTLSTIPKGISLLDYLLVPRTVNREPLNQKFVKGFSFVIYALSIQVQNHKNLNRFCSETRGSRCKYKLIIGGDHEDIYNRNCIDIRTGQKVAIGPLTDLLQSRSSVDPEVAGT